MIRPLEKMTNRPPAKALPVATIRPAVLSVRRGERQDELFPLTTVIEMPDHGSTADVWGKVQAVDTQIYLVKTDERGAGPIRASEWVGTLLAEEMNMPCATPKVIRLSDGQLGFGSRWIGSVADAAITSQILTCTTVGTGTKPVPGLAALLSALFAFDMFINNVDRHDENYISVDHNGTRRFYAIDFGRSLFWRPDMDEFPLPSQPTRVTFRRIAQRHGLDKSAALAMVDRLSGLGPRLISSILSSMPVEWLDRAKRETFLDWWQSEARQQRLERLRVGLIDGTLL